MSTVHIRNSALVTLAEYKVGTTACSAQMTSWMSEHREKEEIFGYLIGATNQNISSIPGITVKKILDRISRFHIVNRQ